MRPGKTNRQVVSNTVVDDPSIPHAAVARPIGFVTPLIQAILAGWKTQTRRLIRPTPDCVGRSGEDQPVAFAAGKIIRCRFGRPGDQLWVQERWADASHDSTLFDIAKGGIVYAADLVLPLKGRWKPARFMPRRHSRITLTINEVRIERLTQISAHDAIAEGFDPSADGPDPVAWFRKVWDDLSDDATSWAADPFVWVIDFTVLSRGLQPAGL